MFPPPKPKASDKALAKHIFLHSDARMVLRRTMRHLTVGAGQGSTSSVYTLFQETQGMLLFRGQISDEAFAGSRGKRMHWFA